MLLMNKRVVLSLISEFHFFKKRFQCLLFRFLCALNLFEKNGRNNIFLQSRIRNVRSTIQNFICCKMGEKKKKNFGLNTFLQ